MKRSQPISSVPIADVENSLCVQPVKRTYSRKVLVPPSLEISKDNCIRNVDQVQQTISLKESVSPATVLPVEVVDIGSVQLVSKAYARKPIRMS